MPTLNVCSRATWHNIPGGNQETKKPETKLGNKVEGHGEAAGLMVLANRKGSESPLPLFRSVQL